MRIWRYCDLADWELMQKDRILLNLFAPRNDLPLSGDVRGTQINPFSTGAHDA